MEQTMAYGSIGTTGKLNTGSGSNITVAVARELAGGCPLFAGAHAWSDTTSSTIGNIAERNKMQITKINIITIKL